MRSGADIRWTLCSARRTVASVFGSARNGMLPQFGGPTPDDFWGDLEASHRMHRAAAIKLAIGVALLVILAIAVHPGFLVFAAPLAIILAIELVVIRRARSTGNAPKH